jgi:hypothetical protein
MRLSTLLTTPLMIAISNTMSPAADPPKPSAATTKAATGWVLTYEVLSETPQMKMPPLTQTITVQDQLVRIDMGAQMSMISNSESGEQYVVMHFMKGYQHVSPSQTKEVNEEGLKQLKRDAGATPFELKPSGQTAVINGYNAKEYVARGATGETTHQWVTTDLPDYRTIREAMDRGFSKAPHMQQQMESWAKIDGFAVRTELESPQRKNTVTLVSAERKALSPEVFQPPAGYTALPQTAPPQQ